MEKEVSKIGIFIYDCESKLKNILSTDEACSKLEGLGFVCFKSLTPRFTEVMCDFEKYLKDNEVSKIVVAGCNPRPKKQIFKNSLKKMGLNPYLVNFVNLNEVIGYKEKKRATEKAVNLVVRAAKWIKMQEPIGTQKVLLNQKVLVLGSGIAGIETALILAEGGLDTILIEETSHLGGGAVAIENLKSLVESKIEALTNEKKVRIINSSYLVDLNGHAGKFIARVDGKQKLTVEVGAIVVATGYKPILPVQELGENPDSLIIGQKDMGNRLSLGKNIPQRVCFLIDLVDEDLKISTQALLKQALTVKEKFGSDVICFCRDLKVSFDGGEELYKKAREAGVLFFKYAEKPEIKLSYNTVEVHLINEDYPYEKLIFESDLLVVGEKAVPGKKFEELAKLLSVNLDSKGFFQEENVKLLPTFSSKRGVFFVGGCRFPQNIEETFSEARGTAGEVLSFLSKGEIELDLTSAKINPDKCVLCLTCIRTCPHGAIVVDYEEETAKVIPLACQSCGICASECPVMAIELPLYTNAQIIGQLSDVVGEAG
ncbi:4Fe-4S binding protein [Candidatus Oleimmundimicrobium sp.]|uniref:4Fe-4S binding protein n=1 Tax=Candidatus Oleimmundimicrobium sp. TaxID=3060597 RepID=UPI002723B9DE|nr:4Fe-4S binding protein [Candidatus Oleimmundimicrobium sp.]MDO8886263.1 4Fe-4S binding protein [Candidatus Oleimmundimicrobium sp.]